MPNINQGILWWVLFSTTRLQFSSGICSWNCLCVNLCLNLQKISHFRSIFITAVCKCLELPNLAPNGEKLPLGLFNPWVWERSWRKGMAISLQVFSPRIPWTEGLEGLSMRVIELDWQKRLKHAFTAYTFHAMLALYALPRSYWATWVFEPLSKQRIIRSLYLCPF